MRSLFLLFLLCGALSRIGAAQVSAYQPFYSADTTQVQQLAAAHRALVQKHFGTPPAGNSEYRDHYKRIAREAAADVYNSVRFSALLDPALNPYVQRVFKQILAANPQLPPVQLVLSRNPEPNAHAVGSGTIMLNLGLLARLENESQLAFVLCHELAHVQARHMDTSLRERLTTLHSRELRREVRRIVAAEYNIDSKLKSLVLGLSLNSTYHQRAHEKQADSLGYTLLKRSRFDATQAYRALQLLDKIDEPLSAQPLELARFFGCAASPYPLPDAALAKPKSIFTVAAPTKTTLELTDTLKSHPDCAKRMRYLRDLSQGQVADGPPATPPAPEFARIQALSRLEAVQSWFDFDCYDHALFEALQLLREQPQNQYLRAIVTLSLFELREHLLNHRFTEVVSNVSPRQPESFRQLLTALYAWKAEDYSGLSACFAQTASLAPSGATDEYALAASYAAATMASDAAAKTWRQQYLAHHQNGRFNRLLFPKTLAKKPLR